MRKDILNILDKIQAVIGPCDYDDFDDDWSGNLIVYSGAYEGLGCEIDVEEKTFRPFVSFPVVGVDEEHFDNNKLDLESIELENNALLEQNGFIFYLKTHEYRHNVCVWDDGGPFDEYVSTIYVGFSPVSESKDLSEFLNVYKSYRECVALFQPNDFRKFILQILCQAANLFHEGEDDLIIQKALISFKMNERVDSDDNLKTFVGNENFLIVDGTTVYYTDKGPVEIFLKSIKWCELFECISYHLIDEPLSKATFLNIKTDHMSFTVRVYQSDDRIVENIEEMGLVTQLSCFHPFSTQRLDSAYSYYKSDIHPDWIPFIVTEGPTDWKHLKKFIAKFYPELQVKFHKLDPKMSPRGDYRSEMGSSELLKMCKDYARIPQERPYIFIADRDVEKITKALGDTTKDFKKWGNNVYSMVLPVPKHRVDTPDICIELLYSDEDLGRKYLCKDGVERKLYISSEFNSDGTHKTEPMRCTYNGLCCSRSPKVLDGSHKERIVRCDNTDGKNYALSKQDFADYVTIEKDSESYEAFRNVVDIINKIIWDARLHKE